MKIKISKTCRKITIKSDNNHKKMSFSWGRGSRLDQIQRNRIRPQSHAKAVYEIAVCRRPTAARGWLFSFPPCVPRRVRWTTVVICQSPYAVFSAASPLDFLSSPFYILVLLNVQFKSKSFSFKVMHRI